MATSTTSRPTTGGGYDAPLEDVNDDHLERSRFARTIYDTLASTPDDWSTPGRHLRVMG